MSRAIEVGRVKATYRPFLGNSLRVVDNIPNWLETAESYIESTVVRPMFCQTLTMDFKVDISRCGQVHFDPVAALADFERCIKRDDGRYPGNDEEAWMEGMDRVFEFRSSLRSCVATALCS